METVILSTVTIRTDIKKITISNHFKEHSDVSIMEISIPVTLDTTLMFQHGLQLKLLLRTQLRQERKMCIYSIYWCLRSVSKWPTNFYSEEMLLLMLTENTSKSKHTVFGLEGQNGKQNSATVNLRTHLSSL